MLVALAAVVVGTVAGVLSGAAGLGGAVLSTPGVRLLGAPPLIAVGTTVPAIVVASAVGTFNYLRSRNCELGVATATASTGVVFAVIGAHATRYVGGRILMVATGVLVVYGGVRILVGRRANQERNPSTVSPSSPRSLRYVAAAAIGCLAGFLSGLLGVGGGIVMLPSYYLLLKMPVKSTTGTSLLVAGILAVPGSFAHWRLGNIDWKIAAGLATGAVIGSYAGSRLTVASRERLVRIYVGALLVAIGVVFAAAETLAILRSGTLH